MPNINEERKARLKKRAARKDTKAAKAEAPVEQEEFGPAQELKAALEALGFLQITDCKVNEERTKILILHRVFDVRSWIPVIALLRKEQERSDWRLHICREYLSSNTSRFGVGYIWNFAVQADDIEMAVKDLRRMLDLVSSNMIALPAAEAPPRKAARSVSPKEEVIEVAMADGEFLEYPLRARPDRNKPEVSLFAATGKRKGAHYISQDH